MASSYFIVPVWANLLVLVPTERIAIATAPNLAGLNSATRAGCYHLSIKKSPDLSLAIGLLIKTILPLTDGCIGFF